MMIDAVWLASSCLLLLLYSTV